MKTQVLVSVYNLNTNEEFETKIANAVNEHLSYYKMPRVSVIYVSDARIELASGYGQYKKSVTISINNEEFNFKSHTTDSESYDLLRSDDVDEQKKDEILKGIIIDALEDDDNLEKIELALTNQEE
jgi:hypothetical protein